MSNKFLRNTQQLLKAIDGTTTYKMDVHSDEDGYSDKECPNLRCLSKFKVNAEDWGKLLTKDEVHCPFCGHVDGSDKWWTTEQVKQAERQAIQNLKAQIGQVLQKDMKEFNRTSSTGFITMKMKVSGITRVGDLPAKALEEMQQKIACESCETRYAVIGSAFYCPCCGHNSAKLTFQNTIEKVKSKINNLDAIRETIVVHDKNEAERACVSLVETSVPDLVMAIQRLCECVYGQLPNAKSLRKNVFQRIDDGDVLWREAYGKGYGDWLTVEEFRLLRKFFQQRHLLQHKDGLVDTDYISKSGDTSYQVGQRLVIKKSDVLRYLHIAEKLGGEIIALTTKKPQERTTHAY